MTIEEIVQAIEKRQRKINFLEDEIESLEMKLEKSRNRKYPPLRPLHFQVWDMMAEGHTLADVELSLNLTPKRAREVWEMAKRAVMRRRLAHQWHDGRWASGE